MDPPLVCMDLVGIHTILFLYLSFQKCFFSGQHPHSGLPITYNQPDPTVSSMYTLMLHVT